MVNALVHVLAAFVLRPYKPGFITATVLFIPLAGYTLYSEKLAIDYTFQYLGITLAIAIHASIMLYLLRRRRLFSNHID